MPPGFSSDVGDRMSYPALETSAYADAGETERESAVGMLG